MELCCLCQARAKRLTQHMVRAFQAPRYSALNPFILWFHLQNPGKALIRLTNYFAGFNANPGSGNLGSFGNHDTSRSVRESMYLSHPPSGHSGQHAQAGPMTYDRHADQMPYPASSFYEPRANYEVTQTSPNGIDTREFVKVASYKPDRGPQGSQVYVYLQTTHDLANYPLNISLMFATRLCTPTLDRLEARGSFYNYLLGAQAPPHASTGWASPYVPLRLQTQCISGHDGVSLEIGSFFYTDAQVVSQALPQDPSRKRKLSVGSADRSLIPTKRSSNQQLANSPVQYPTSPYAASPNRVYPYVYQTRPGPSIYAPSSIRSDIGVQEASGSSQSTQNTQSGIEKFPYQNSTSTSRSSAWPSPFTFTTESQSSGSPALSGASSSRFLALDSSNAGNPKLIRTSTLQPSHGSSSSAASALYPYGYKAILHINGDLNTMVDGWTTEECTAKRRLVKFWRSQNNNNIDAEFEAVPADSSPPKGICVSCIWWENKQECYVTSVDTIYLLESLVAIRFTVEEKNRIRRNLEGLGPITVSKTRSDSEEFFSLIMGFPNPKPRNIEKDVKVFPWRVLHLALKKIIGKYVSHPTTPTFAA